MKRIGIGLGWLLTASFVALFFVVPGLMISTAARTGQGILFAEIDGRDTVIITYDDDGFSGLGFFAPSGHGGRIAALDLDTAEMIWNRGLDGEPGSLTRMVAAGDEYAYLETTFGFCVIALADGAVVATENDIPGLGEVDGLRTTFAFSRAEEAVAVERIPADGDVLGFEVPSGSPPGTPGKRLIRLNPGGSGMTVGTETFVNPGFVAQSVFMEPELLACPQAQWDDDVFPDGRVLAEPLGAEAGYAVIDHSQSARTGDRQITVVDAVSGEVLGSNPAEGGLVDAATAPSGQAVVIVDRFLPGVLPNWTTTPVTSTLLLVSPEGSMQEVVLAPHGWLGLPW